MAQPSTWLLLLGLLGAGLLPPWGEASASSSLPPGEYITASQFLVLWKPTAPGKQLTMTVCGTAPTFLPDASSQPEVDFLTSIFSLSVSPAGVASLTQPFPSNDAELRDGIITNSSASSSPAPVAGSPNRLDINCTAIFQKLLIGFSGGRTRAS
jgi:hypothetical protein